MNKKQIFFGAVAIAVLTVILTSMFFFSPLGVRLVGIGADSYVAKSYGKMMMLEQYIEDNYMGNYAPNMLADNAVHGYIRALNDPYSSYFNAKEFESLNQQLGSEYRGIGITVMSQDGKIVISGVEKDSPAMKAGIIKDDIILKINGKEYSGETLDSAIDVIKSTKKGENILLSIERSGELKEITVTVETISKKAVEYQMLSEGIGYIYISTFVNELKDEFTSALDDLQKQGLKGLVIDLRNNPGGALDAAVDVADILLPKCTIVTVKNKKGHEEVYTSDKDELSLPISVLVNENSASASEVLSGALHDNGKATLVGKKTFGKGVVQSVVAFGDGSGFSLTVAKYFTPSGVCINGIGITPDIEVDLPEGFDYVAGEISADDTQLKAAVNALK